jgi:hypothetical protein
MNKYGHIKNPLTVVAIFAGIAEVSGTVVMPFISPVNQATYMWFLMIFPTLLVAIFFLRLTSIIQFYMHHPIFERTNLS